MTLEKEYIRVKNAHGFLDISKTSFWRLTKTDDFPKKIILEGAVVYNIQELRDYVQGKQVSA